MTWNIALSEVSYLCGLNVIGKPKSFASPGSQSEKVQKPADPMREPVREFDRRNLMETLLTMPASLSDIFNLLFTAMCYDDVGKKKSGGVRIISAVDHQVNRSWEWCLVVIAVIWWFSSCWGREVNLQ